MFLRPFLAATAVVCSSVTLACGSSNSNNGPSSTGGNGNGGAPPGGEGGAAAVQCEGASRTLVTDERRVSALALDDRALYFTALIDSDRPIGSIRAFDLETPGIETIAEVEHPTGLAITPERLVWSVERPGYLGMLPRAGGLLTRVNYGRAPYALAARGSAVFFLYADAMPGLSRLADDSEEPAALTTEGARPAFLAALSDEVVWYDVVATTLSATSLDTGETESLVDGVSVTGGLAADANAVVWSDGTGATPKLYVVGRTEQARLTLLVSEDAGETWSTLIPEIDDQFAQVNLIALNAAGDGPAFFSREDATSGTTLWTWDERADEAAALVLSLPNLQKVAGFAFGATPSSVFVAARAQTGASVVSGSLYVSDDAGQSFSLVSDAGPRYTCLQYRAGALYACADQTDIAFSPFAFGRSDDGGLSWLPVMTYRDDLIAPAPACGGGACRDTVDALCVKSGRCPSPAATPMPVPTGTPATPTDSSGCSFSAATSSRAASDALLALALAAAALRRRSSSAR